VGTYTTGGVLTSSFLKGDSVRIEANSSNIPITINVTDPDGILIYTEIYNGSAYNKILSGLAEKIGKYTVEVTSPFDTEQKNYARTYYLVAAPPIVGGQAAPINKVKIEPELQIPWILLSTILLPLVATTVFVTLKKKKTA
jgi:hypothetical protein